MKGILLTVSLIVLYHDAISLREMPDLAIATFLGSNNDWDNFEENSSSEDSSYFENISFNNFNTDQSVKSTTETIKQPKASISSRDVQICMRSCSVTSEYNPVCGTDYVTYTNPSRLICAQYCGVDVNILAETSCLAVNLLSMTQSSSTTTTTTETYYETTPLSTPITTISTKPITTTTTETYYETTPLSTPITTISTKPITTPSTTVSTLSWTTSTIIPNSTTSSQPNLISTTRPYTLASTATPHTITSTVLSTTTLAPTSAIIVNSSIESSTAPVSLLNHQPNIQECILSCLRTNEERPVCGTNNVTYINPEHLICAQFCGVDVRFSKFSACTDVKPLEIQTVPTTATTASGLELETITDTLICLQTCPITSELALVCGTDNKTYNNPSILECHKNCGINVSMAKSEACAQTMALQEKTPDGTTEINIVPINEPKTTSKPDRYVGNIYVPPQDIVNVIFNDQTTKEPHEFDLDPRFNIYNANRTI